MFGTDHPFSIADPAENIAAIHEAFSSADAMKVLSGAVIDLFEIMQTTQTTQ